MKTIWKFQLDIVDRQTVIMPAGARVLTAQMQRDTLCLWALVDDARSGVERTVWVFGTGHVVHLPADVEYVGTAQAMQGNLVWHVWTD